MNVLLLIDNGFGFARFSYLNGTLLFFALLFFGRLFWKDARQLESFEQKEEANYIAVFQQYTEQLESQMTKELLETKVAIEERADIQFSWGHELKTPLTTMQLLIDKLPASEQKQLLQLEWMRMNLLVDQSLHSLRLNAAENDLLFRKIDMKRILIDEVKMLKSWCRIQDVAIDLDIEEDEVVTDAKWLSFIIRQLLSNSLKYSNKGGTLTITYKNRCLAIQDEGMGILEEDVPRIFDKGFTGTNGRKQSASTGMGLYLAKQSAEQLHAKLFATSEIHVGTTVYLQLPKQNDYTNTLM
ncbi:sensor histidine kinase [Kurthia senegalensis]|uniref:sensor histidine kinase n=1 Tax=Kurthia senegalensis TaxID=1033740 RepID=UPI0002890A1E|nr:sensor histidine kinase [Kurthia senegalensis]